LILLRCASLTCEADVIAEDAAGDGGDEAREDGDAGDLAGVRLVPRVVVHDHGSRHCARVTRLPRRRNQATTSSRWRQSRTGGPVIDQRRRER
jgi:hypothetical protein